MNWLQRYEFRFVEGTPTFSKTPFAEPASSHSLWWVSDQPPRPLDYLSLAAISDSFFLRLLHVRGTFGPMGTVSLSTYFHATPEELAEQGTAALLGAARAKRFNGRFMTSTWSCGAGAAPYSPPAARLSGTRNSARRRVLRTWYERFI